jgi:carbonic anhydrase/acetyltransferase-like protein (isoleucine patch superfamily)
VGIGASVKNNAKVESFAVVAAGSVVGEGVNIPSNQIWAGSPAQYLRDITPEER